MTLKPVTVPKTISIEALTIVNVDVAELTNPMTLFCDQHWNIKNVN